MIVDSQELDGSQPLTAEVCIVGAGPVGIALALALGDAGRDVILLEAGGFRREKEVHDFYRGTVVDPALHYPLEEYRERRLGGSTTVWGGRCVPYDAIDFEQRPWIPDSGWPIAFDSLDRYLGPANELCEAGAADYTVESAFDRPLKEMIAGFKGTAFSTNTLERFSPPTDFGRKYRERLAASREVRVIVHAGVVEVETNSEGTTVAALDVRTRSGGKLRIAAKQVVLAPGGLEATRLLLASRGVHAEGIGNAHGVLGRYYMCHLAGTMGSFQVSAGAGAVWNGYDIADDGTYCRRRLALRPEAQREHRIGNFIARLHHTRIGDPSHGSGVLSALRLGKFIVPRRFRARLKDETMSPADALRHAANVVRDAPAIARFATHMLVKRQFAKRKYPSVVVRPPSNRYSLDFHAEQAPNPMSQVRLSRMRDATGMPRLEVDWHYMSEDVETIATSLRLFAEDVRRSGCGTFDFDPEQVEAEMTRYGAYPGHHIGTARMGDDPKRSVVDANCRVHGVNNLYVAGSAVFPTSSQANPTLLAVMLALRLGEHLRDRLVGATA